MDNTLFTEQAPALRDFFASVDAKDLREAADRISTRFGLPMDRETDWVEVEYDFNRLFVGPAAVPAPPYASAYQPEPTLMGEPALEVREAYRALGLEVPDRNATPDDHLAYELDAVAALGGAEGDPTASQVLNWFINDHMHGWIPRFAAAVREQPSVSGPVRMAVDALTAWLASARTDTGINES
ncbi:molecular chaperone TorD family protein [Pseudodesulfovibrio indicus]|uniref:TorD/DmsD family molecular chaperone n=1 Tax=Pseudodesulfovibrio indicus TaxID=1716143 RepID=UPI00292E147D|nr:molecular chaperone TorD family protein [Pseudodesulfovibrio indicus]